MKLRHGLILTAVAASLISCGGGDTSSTGTTTTAAGPTAASTADGSTPAAAGTTITVSETEFSIELTSTALAAGTYTFQVTNDGTFPHSLTIDGPGVTDEATETLTPGSAGEVSNSQDLWIGVSRGLLIAS